MKSSIILILTLVSVSLSGCLNVQREKLEEVKEKPASESTSKRKEVEDFVVRTQKELRERKSKAIDFVTNEDGKSLQDLRKEILGDISSTPEPNTQEATRRRELKTKFSLVEQRLEPVATELEMIGEYDEVKIDTFRLEENKARIKAKVYKTLQEDSAKELDLFLVNSDGKWSYYKVDAGSQGTKIKLN